MSPATGPSPSDSSPSSAPPPESENPSADVVTTCKRRISELEAEINQIYNLDKKQKSEDHSFLIAGRCIRRLVSLTDRVEDLVSKADRRVCLEDTETPQDEEANRLYSAYKQLLHWKPSLGRVFTSQPHILRLADVYKDLNRGADSARGDDAASLKQAVVHWLAAAHPNDAPGLQLGEKTGRGFDHDTTGRLLCPVDYDWQDDQGRAAIRDFHPDHLVTADSWPAFLYEDERYDGQDPTKGLFKNDLLLKAFKHIFTSPSSALKTDIVHEPTPRPKRHQKLDECRTRSHVASLLGMKSVSPRAIAYIAVQLHFALSNCGSWRIIDGEFNHHDFYNNIIRFFEDATTPAEKKFVQDLLFWWNRNVFGRSNMSVYRPRHPKKLSVALSLPQGRENASTTGTATPSTQADGPS